MSLARIREQLANRGRVQEVDKIEGEDNNGFTYSFDPSLRRKYEEVMKRVSYGEDEAFADSDVSKGYFCGNCSYMIAKSDSPTGYWCTKFYFPDRPYGCSAGYEKKDE